MSSYTDDEITEALLSSANRLRSRDQAYYKQIVLLRWLAAEYPRLKADAERYRYSRLQAWLESCVDDLVVGTQQAKESEFNAGYDQEIDAARGKEG